MYGSQQFRNIFDQWQEHLVQVAAPEVEKLYRELVKRMNEVKIELDRLSSELDRLRSGDPNVPLANNPDPLIEAARGWPETNLSEIRRHGADIYKRLAELARSELQSG
jgi:hypothetical protein